MFKHSQDLDLVSVPCNGSAPAVQSVLADHTPIAFVVLTPVVPHVKEGKLRALAVTTAKRAPALPDVPTLAEAGLPGQESDAMQGVLSPAGTPEPIIAMLHRKIDKDGRTRGEAEDGGAWIREDCEHAGRICPAAFAPTSRNGRR